MRRVLMALVAVLTTAGLASEAAGQCTMTHTAMDGAYLLCAVGGTEWEWTGPAGFTAATICVNVSTPGTYTVRVFDGFNGLWSAPCDFTFSAVPTGPQCGITGADSVCAGSSTTWCTSPGDYAYAWSGPGGWSSTAACVDVSVAGDYTLVVTDRQTGAASDPCRRKLGLRTCQVEQAEAVCPSPASWWARACFRMGGTLDAATFAAVAAQVDQRSSALAYGGTADGLCALLRPGHDMDGGRRARRQFAAVLANLSAAELGVTATDGHAVGLSATAALEGIPGIDPGWTVSDWVDNADATLVRLSGAPARSRAARDELRRLARQARALNHMTAGCATLPSARLDDDDDLEAEGTSAPGSGGGTISTTPLPEPLAGRSTLRWTLLRAETVELAVMDITGRRVRHLASGTYAAGSHDFVWDGRDDDGHAVRSGAYFVAGRVGEQRLSARLMILR